ncbi:hypothetical protein ACFQE5_04585 [Pseudonocardia hispaniensis]|uniref:Lipoprotein n=1 Tax=Pseudonocardia hispaniensis TaxID=904933 RepID=A0ABW1IYD1_9PSEU
MLRSGRRAGRTFGGRRGRFVHVALYGGGGRRDDAPRALRTGGQESPIVHSACGTVRRLAGATAVVLGIIVTAACGPSSAQTPPPTPAPAAAPTSAPPASQPSADELSTLVVQAGDIPIPGLSGQGVQRVEEGTLRGVATSFSTEDGRRRVGETIVLLPDPDAARSAVQGAASTTQQQRPGATMSVVPVGEYAVLFTGFEYQGTASTLLLFSQGVASVAMDFRSPAGEPVPPEVATAAGERQAALLASGLPH